MAYCSNCGEKLAEEALFCPKCGTKTKKGVQTKVSASSEEFRETINKMGQELEKAFTVAAKDIHEAFQTAQHEKTYRSQRTRNQSVVLTVARQTQTTLFSALSVEQR